MDKLSSQKTFCDYVAHLIKTGQIKEFSELSYSVDSLDAVVVINEPDGGKQNQKYLISIKKLGV